MEEPLKEVVLPITISKVQEQLELELSKERVRCHKFERQVRAKEVAILEAENELARERGLKEELKVKLQSTVSDYQKIEVELASDRTKLREAEQKQRTLEEEKAKVKNEFHEERFLNMDLQRRLQRILEERDELMVKVVFLEDQQRGQPHAEPNEHTRSVSKFEGTEVMKFQQSRGMQTSGVAWDKPSDCMTEVPCSDVDASIENFTPLLVGAMLQALPGMQSRDSDGSEYFCEGDVGTVLHLGKMDAAPLSPVARRPNTPGTGGSCPEAEVGLNVRWARTGRTCQIGQSQWMWFRFIRMQDPVPGDFVQVIPGADCMHSLMGQCCSAGDVGHIISVSDAVGFGTKEVSVRWPRTGQESVLRQDSWAWLRIVGRSGNSNPRLHPPKSIVSDESISLLWMCIGEVVVDPKAGDIMQAHAGVSFTDQQGTCMYKEGDVGRVIDVCVSGAADLSANVLWMRSGRKSMLRHSSWPSFTCLRVREAKVGDLLQVPTGMQSLDEDGKQQYVAGDVGTIIRFFKMHSTSEDFFGVFWARTGHLSEYPTVPMLAKFYLIPLQSIVPTYLKDPLAVLT